MRKPTRSVLLSALLLATACQLSSDELDGDVAPDGGLGDDDDDGDLDAVALQTMPFYQLPFKCHQEWRGNTYTSHNPQLAIDFNHDGGDFGRDVLAAAKGTVTVVADTGSDSYGKWIEIGHGGGHRTRYAHLSRRIVHVGQHVHKGQKIGEVGQSGGATGPHLHYEQRVDTSNVVKVRFNGHLAFYYGERRYTSHNCN